MARILITGAAGFIGSHLSERLLGRGDIVLGLDNFDPFYPRKQKEANLLPSRAQDSFQFAEVDIRDATELQKSVRSFSPDAVVHIAAKAGVRPSILNPEEYVSVNVGGTLNLLRACEGMKLKHFIFASSSSVYGNAAKPPFQEDDVTSLPESPYAATKKAGELLCHTYHKLSGMPMTCLRFFTVIGPRQRPDLAIHKFVDCIENGKPLPFYGDGTAARDYTFIGDTVKGISRALDHPAGYAIFNLGRNEPVTLSELVMTIERVLNKKAILDRQPDQQGDVRVTCADITRAQQAFGYSPNVSLEEGVRQFVEWWHTQHTNTQP